MTRDLVKELLRNASYDQIAILFGGGQLNTPYLLHAAAIRARAHLIGGYRPNRKNARIIATLNAAVKGLRTTPDLCMNTAELNRFLEYYQSPRPWSILMSVVTRCRKQGWAVSDIQDQEIFEA